MSKVKNSTEKVKKELHWYVKSMSNSKEKEKIPNYICIIVIVMDKLIVTKKVKQNF